MVREIDANNPWRRMRPVAQGPTKRPRMASDASKPTTKTRRPTTEVIESPGAIYAVTDRSKKNAGDFLIHKRATEFLYREKGLQKGQLTKMIGWRQLDKSVLNRHKALIICGGPALDDNFYPSIYPLTKDLRDIKIPIFLLGVGAAALKSNTNAIKFTIKSLEALQHVVDNGGAISVRDPLTADLLKKYKIKSTVTGCPVYFHPTETRELKVPPERMKVVFTPGFLNRDPRLNKHHEEVLKKLMETFRQVTVSFHRGRGGMDTFNCRTMDITNSADKFEQYKQFDLHVGYRVHAHIWFLSTGRPSFLIPTDVRGLGANALLGLQFENIPWYNLSPQSVIYNILDERRLEWVYTRKALAKINELEETMKTFVRRIP